VIEISDPHAAQSCNGESLNLAQLGLGAALGAYRKSREISEKARRRSWRTDSQTHLVVSYYKIASLRGMSRGRPS